MNHTQMTLKAHANLFTLLLFVLGFYLLWPAVFGTDNAPQQTIEAPQ